jgi:hypothetical protein
VTRWAVPLIVVAAVVAARKPLLRLLTRLTGTWVGNQDRVG